MPRQAITSVTAGELSKDMIGRADVARFANGLQRAENVMIKPTGMWSSRYGFGYKGAPKLAGQRCILRRFMFSTEQAYILEFGHLYVRFWKDGGRIENPIGTPVELATPYTEDMLPRLKFTQSADVLFIFIDVLAIRAIRRTSHVNWTIGIFHLLDGPYLPENVDVTKVLTLSAASGPVTVTAGGFAPFVATDFLRMFAIREGGLWKWCRITGFINASTVTADVAHNFTAAPTNTPDWRLGLYSDTTGYPGCGTIYEQRLVIAGGTTVPDRLDGSKIGAYDVFTIGMNGDDAWSFSLATPDVQRILSLAAIADLVVFAAGQVHRVGGDTDRSTITPTNVSARVIATWSASIPQPAPVDQGVMFFDFQQRKVREIRVVPEASSYATDELTILADHISGGRGRVASGFGEMAWASSPLPMMWLTRSDGQGVSMAYARSENVLAFMRHLFGGGGRIESVAVIPGPHSDEVWAAFARTRADGTVWRSIERYEVGDDKTDAIEDQLRLDCALSHISAPAANLTLGALSGAGVVFTASAAVFAAGDVGRYIRHRVDMGDDRHGRPDYRTGIGQIVGFTDAQHVVVDIVVAFTSLTIPAGEWRRTVTTITGLDHLNGYTVTAVGDGKPMPGLLVTAGTITLPQPAGTVHVGLSYQARILTMPLDASGAPAQGQGRLQRIDRVVVRYERSLGGKIIKPDGQWDRIVAPDMSEFVPSGTPSLQSGDVQVVIADEYARRAEIEIIQDEPLPLNVALMVPNVYAPWVQP